MSNLRKSIANFLTIINLLLGFSAIILIALSLLDDYNYIELSCIFIFIASLIDVFDGKVARKLGTSGDFGKELDSLADIISFCLTPSFLIFFYAYDVVLVKLPYLILISSLPLVCGAIRLARFNIYFEQSDNSHYLGLPTPANAIFICSSILFILQPSNIILAEFGISNFNIFNLIKYGFFVIYTLISEYTIIVLFFISSILMVTNISYSKFPILRFNGTKNNLVNITCVIIFGIFIFIGILNKEYHIVILFFISYYIVSGMIKAIIHKINGGL